jgi:DNA helicase MCM8
LVDNCVPGDQVTISGILKASKQEEYSNSRSKSVKCLYILYIDGNSIINNRKNDKEFNDMEFSTNDLKAINEIYKEKNLFHLIVNSLCPSIFGHEIVKAGLCLSIFGGCHKYVSEKNKLTIRGDPHCNYIILFHRYNR